MQGRYGNAIVKRGGKIERRVSCSIEISELSVCSWRGALLTPAGRPQIMKSESSSMGKFSFVVVIVVVLLLSSFGSSTSFFSSSSSSPASLSSINTKNYETKEIIVLDHRFILHCALAVRGSFPLSLSRSLLFGQSDFSRSHRWHSDRLRRCRYVKRKKEDVVALTPSRSA